MKALDFMKATFYFKKKEVSKDKLGDNELKILQLIQENSLISITEMAEKIRIWV